MDVPDLRDPAQRDAFRNDNACTTPSVAGDQLLPRFLEAADLPEVPDAAYDRIRRMWEAGQPYENPQQMRD